MECPFGMKPRWERRKNARPQELLAAALDLFVERGFALTRLEDVAKRAGVSKGTLYLYFENKEELFKAVVRENIVPTLGAAEQEVAQFQGSSADLLRHLMHSWWQLVGATKLSGIAKLMLSECGNFPDLAQFYEEEVIFRSDKLIHSVLQRGIVSGEFRQFDVPQLVKVIVAPILMLMLWKHSFAVANSSAANNASPASPTNPIAPQAVSHTMCFPYDNPHAYLDCFLDMCLHGVLSSNASHAACPAPDVPPIV